jgi:type II secretory pathway predicted ATPase ExeA
MLIESHFGLRRRPFPATPDWSCYYPATSHERALQRLLDGLADGEALVLLTGAPGLGKTLLCHCLLERLGEGVEACFLTHTRLRDRASLLQALLHDLGLPSEAKGEQDLRLALIDHLLARFRAGKRTLLLLDEAHHLGVDLLEELRLLGNLEGAAGRAVQVVLVAQPELLQTLNWPDLASLKQRLAVRAAIDPLGLEEAADYLLHHLRQAGGRAERILGLEALEVLGRQTGGVPRLLNQAASLALRLAMEASASEVDVEVALEALSQLGLAEPAAAESAGSPEQVLPLPGDEGDDACRLFMAPGRTA